jgi:hypothetical protein
MKSTCQKHFCHNTKRKNLGTANFADFNEAGQKCIRKQVLQTLAQQEVSKTMSMASSVTTPSSVLLSPTAGRGRGRGDKGSQGGQGRIFIIEVPVLAAGNSLKPMMPIAIHSNLPHIVMQFGTELDCPNSPSIHCAVNLCAALLTGNFHFFASLVKRFPHCLAKVYAPQDYAPIILSGVVQSHQDKSVTTELEVRFQFHIPYKTTDGDESSLMIRTGPHVSVNTILGLSFTQGTGMILNLINNLAECKYLDCPPFLIDFQRTSNNIPVTDKLSAEFQVTGIYRDVIRKIEHLEQYYTAKVPASSLDGNRTPSAVHFGSRSLVCAAIIDSDSTTHVTRPARDITHRWVPPSSVHEDDDNYHSSVLREDGYL